MKNWPTIVSAFAAAAAPVIVHFGWLSTEQMGAIGIILAPVFTAFVHRMTPPVSA